MPPRSKALADASSNSCAIKRSLGVLADAWTFLLLREALLGRRTFAEFRDSLDISTDVLTARLTDLIECGVMEKVPYRKPGQRTRSAYSLTAAGEELNLVLAALQQWGAEHLPAPEDSEALTVLPLVRDSHRRVRVAFVDTDGHAVAQQSAQFLPATFAK